MIATPSITIRNVSYWNESPTRGRPRDPELHRRITAAVLELLGEVGYEKLTFEAVAKRCQTSKTSLYRRWSSKREMVLASIKDGPAQHSSAPFSLGMSLRDDLLALMNRLKHTLTESNANTAFMLLSAGLEDPELCDAIEQTMGPTGARLPREVIDAAIQRGELSEEAHPFAYEEVVGAALLLRHANGLALDHQYLEALVDGVVLPALTTSHHHTNLPAGLFSGHADSKTDAASEELP